MRDSVVNEIIVSLIILVVLLGIGVISYLFIIKKGKLVNLKKAIKVVCAIIYFALVVIFAVIAIGDIVTNVKGTNAIEDLKSSTNIDDPILSDIVKNETDSLEFDYGNNTDSDVGVYEVYCKFDTTDGSEIKLICVKLDNTWYVKFIFIDGEEYDGSLSDFMSY